MEHIAHSENNLVTVIIPVYNVEGYILQCIESIGNQTLSDKIECIIVDDCGIDKSLEIAEKYIASYKGHVSFNIIRHKTNKGLSCARNTGLRNASGKYVYFLDSDDYIATNCIENLINSCNTDNYDVIVGRFWSDSKDNKLYNQCQNRIHLHGSNIMRAYNQSLLYVMAWNKLYRREFLLENNLMFYPGILHEDCLWSFEVYSLAKTILVLNEPTYFYRYRPGSIMTSLKAKKQVDDMLMIAKEMSSFANHYNLLHRQEVNDAFQGWVELLLKTCCKNNLSVKDIYKALRSKCDIKIFQLIKADFFSPRRIFRDFHYLMGATLGFIVYKYIKILK